MIKKHEDISNCLISGTAIFDPEIKELAQVAEFSRTHFMTPARVGIVNEYSSLKEIVNVLKGNPMTSGMSQMEQY